MSNTFTKAAFTLLMSRDDAALLRAAERAVDILDTNGDDADLAAGYDTLGPRFHAVFPPDGAHRFGAFLTLFEDWHFPYLDAKIDIADEPTATDVKVTFTGDQFGVAQIAELIFRGCKSALPCGFAWSYDCDRLEVGEFGGGCAIITDAGVTIHNTGSLMEQALRDADSALASADAADTFLAAIAAYRPGHDTHLDNFDAAAELSAIIDRARRLTGLSVAPPATGAVQ